MVNDNDEAKSSLGQSTASTNGSSARCFITKTLGPVVILPITTNTATTGIVVGPICTEELLECIEPTTFLMPY